MLWKIPKKIKIYEALGSLADRRIEVSADKTTAKVFSSSGNKFYDVVYDSEHKAIMTNDNGSYWQGYLGYPAITFLLAIGVLSYKKEFAEALRGIAWKDINTKFKNDFNKTISFTHELLEQKGVNIGEFVSEIDRIHSEINKLKLSKLGKQTKPPEGY